MTDTLGQSRYHVRAILRKEYGDTRLEIRNLLDGAIDSYSQGSHTRALDEVAEAIEAGRKLAAIAEVLKMI